MSAVIVVVEGVLQCLCVCLRLLDILERASIENNLEDQCVIFILGF